MTPPPTSIDGTDITGATIDGQQVEEITIDGQTVFTATELPVAYSNLIAWYPFDSTFYGGANADDVTAILGGSGDDTAFDGTVFGSTYLSSGGVTDINTGPNSGAFDFDGVNDRIELGVVPPVPMTMMCNADYSIDNGFPHLLSAENGTGYNGAAVIQANKNVGDTRASADGTNFISGVSPQGFQHHALVVKSDSFEYFIDGNSQGSVSQSGIALTKTLRLGSRSGGALASNHMNGKIDDVRIYNTALSQSQISDIVSNT
jgi:hypothetical protein